MNDTTIHKGLITFSSEKGWFFCEDLDDHLIVFVHQKFSADNRYLHVNDIITFQRIDSPIKLGKVEARDIRYAGHNVARQTGEKAVVS